MDMFEDEYDELDWDLLHDIESDLDEDAWDDLIDDPNWCEICGFHDSELEALWRE